MADGWGIPPMGFGTFGRTGEEGIAAILVALETGYRHIDTAQSYDTEYECGEALRRSGLPRSEVFVTTKVTGANCTREKLVASLERSRDALGVETVDLALIHWPVGPSGRFDMPAYLPELIKAQEQRLTRLVGVSNFATADLDEAERIIGPGRLSTNQFERHPYLQNRRLVADCNRRGITVTCYLPLARGACAGDPVIEEVARAHDASAHQIALAYSLNQGHIVIPTSGKPGRIRENYGAAAIRLSPAELAAIDSCERNGRQIDPVWAPAWDASSG